MPGEPLGAVCVVGSGRVGSTFAARLRERGHDVRVTGRELAVAGADLVLLCVADGAIADVARAVPTGPWVAHVSGATRLDALAPHERRFSLHPLQIVVSSLGPEQLDGAWAAVTAGTDEAAARGRALARALGLEPFDLADDVRPLYHAAAGFAAGFVATLARIAIALGEDCGVPPAAFVPLVRQTIATGFAPAGPLTRGDWATVEAHREALGAARPELLPLYDALVEASRPA